MSKSDQQQVKRLLEGDERALREFFDEYFDRLYRFALSRLRRDSGIAPSLAEEAALTVAMTGEPLHLPPMPPGERRIVHMLLKNHPRVTTESQGEGEERHVVVYPRREAQG